MTGGSGKLYSARFSEGLLPALERFSDSLQMDMELVRFDLSGSLAHARGLAAAGIIGKEDLEALERGLAVVAMELEEGRFSFLPSDEDVHTAVERRVSELEPAAGPKLHTGRSRNDQVSLDLRLYCRDASCRLAEALADTAAALVQAARAHADLPMAGYTHLQRAQPVTVGWHLLAHTFPLLRDAERAKLAYQQANRMPLGAGALAGSTLPLKPDAVAAELGFSLLSENSMDAVSDRDFALDLIYACLSVGVHLSRLGEDLALWSSSEFAFIRLPDRVATGSSLMPQKKNPDIAELLRARVGRSLGSLVAAATVMKGLPLAYDRDLQETKPPLFEAVSNALSSLEAARLLVENLRFDEDRLRASVQDPGLFATDAAEALVREGMPFRRAHEEVAASVREGSYSAPWGAETSLAKRGLDARAGAAQAAFLVRSVRSWVRARIRQPLSEKRQGVIKRPAT